MAVERYRVHLDLVLEVEDPDALLALARARFPEGFPAGDMDLFLPDAAAALERLIDSEAVTAHLPGVAHVNSTTRAALLDPDQQ
jgi:hypothetical protein